MAAVGVLAAIVIFVIGMIAGAVILVSTASRREDHRQRLSTEAPDCLTLAGRFLTGLSICRPNARPGLNGDPPDQGADMSCRQHP
jgi:hypothetical protein